MKQRGTTRVEQARARSPGTGTYFPRQPRLALGPSLEQPNIIQELTCPSHVRGTMGCVPRDRRVQARADSAAIRIARIRARRAGPDRLPCCGSGTGTTERQEVSTGCHKCQIKRAKLFSSNTCQMW